MSYSISIYGHGPSADKVQEVFATAVRALREESPEGNPPGGSCSGTEDETSFNIETGDVSDEPAEAAS